MRLKIILLFLFNMFMLNAQVEQKESVASSSCSQLIKGEIRDKISNKLLVGSEVVLSDKNGAVVETQITNEDATFSFKIKCNTAYKLEGKKEDYTAESKEFKTSNDGGIELKLLIFLDKGEIDFVTDAEASASTLDTIAKAEIAETEVAVDIVADTIEKPVSEPKVKIEAVEEKKTTPDVKPIKKIESKYNVRINPIYFDYESSYLNPEAKKELQKVIALMKQYPKMVLECNGHADSKGATDYNVWMSDRRAKRVVDYIVKRGISPSRISGKGFGETQLVNACTNEVECTDKERAVNRRTEFVIVKM